MTEASGAHSGLGEFGDPPSKTVLLRQNLSGPDSLLLTNPSLGIPAISAELTHQEGPPQLHQLWRQRPPPAGPAPFTPAQEWVEEGKDGGGVALMAEAEGWGH